MSHHDSLRLPPLHFSRQASSFNVLLPPLSSSRTNAARLPPIAAAAAAAAAPAPRVLQPRAHAHRLPPPPATRRPQPIKKTVSTSHGMREVYACPFHNCTRTSTEHSNLKAHMRMHTGERPYACSAPGCKKSFRWKSSLTYHEKAIHTSVKPYKCAPCRKQFVEKRKYKLHLEMCPYVPPSLRAPAASAVPAPAPAATVAVSRSASNVSTRPPH
eukprot:TRINITY_DN63669_c0_g1_i1.p1 TRINITY_DN63669_c0_g1~~TRINITY_DN63669_c0_g1_i1.p1  ORF type:complete len:214 (+),score=42.19 TRINITY_DN63669_c0_g1_i1:219-860(+)